MCFTESLAWTLAIGGFVGGMFIHKFIPNMKYVGNVMFYFAVMELLQALTYSVIDECSFWNKVLTALSGIHICFQPLVTNYMAASEYDDPKVKANFWFLCRLSVIGGLLMFMRGFLEVNGFTHSQRHSCEFAPLEAEHLRGMEMCAVRGKYHMAWNIPLADVSYYFPSINLHAFLCFGGFFAHPEEPILMVKGLILFVTGPLLGEYLSGPNKGEMAAIWCLYSVAQLFLAGAVHFYIINKGRTGNEIAEAPAAKKEK